MQELVSNDGERALFYGDWLSQYFVIELTKLIILQ